MFRDLDVPCSHWLAAGPYCLQINKVQIVARMLLCGSTQNRNIRIHIWGLRTLRNNGNQSECLRVKLRGTLGCAPWPGRKWNSCFRLRWLPSNTTRQMPTHAAPRALHLSGARKKVVQTFPAHLIFTLRKQFVYQICRTTWGKTKGSQLVQEGFKPCGRSMPGPVALPSLWLLKSQALLSSCQRYRIRIPKSRQTMPNTIQQHEP